MSCSRAGGVTAEVLACRFKAGSCNNKPLLSLVVPAITFKDNTVKGFGTGDMMTSVQRSLH